MASPPGRSPHAWFLTPEISNILDSLDGMVYGILRGAVASNQNRGHAQRLGGMQVSSIVFCQGALLGTEIQNAADALVGDGVGLALKVHVTDVKDAAEVVTDAQ